MSKRSGMSGGAVAAVSVGSVGLGVLIGWLLFRKTCPATHEHAEGGDDTDAGDAPGGIDVPAWRRRLTPEILSTPTYHAAVGCPPGLFWQPSTRTCVLPVG